MSSAALTSRVTVALAGLEDSAAVQRLRADRWIWLVFIALAVIAAVGLLAAWWAMCSMQGGYPAMRMPNWQAGGVWKAYCEK